jgi:hypothetical protein
MSCDNVVINIVEPPDSNIDISIGGGGSGGNAVWGSIFGTLSAQTDLWNALLSAGIQNLAYDSVNQQLSITQGNTVILTPLVDDAFNRVIDYLEDNTINIGGVNITQDLFVGRDAYVDRDLTVGGTIFTTTTATVLGTYFTTIGNGQDNSFTIYHNLSTKDISVVVRDLATDTITYPAIQTPTVSSAVLSFSIVPQTSAYAVTVFGGVPSNRVAAYSLTFPKKPRANTLYVSLSGNDNNEGTLPEYPLRTIKKACEVAHNAFVDSFNNPNVKFTIFVGTGDFIEENPIYVPSNTSIIGDNLRRCSIIPKNKQFDILWVNTSVYVWGATFREHLEPSCATAFPDLESPLLTSIALKNLKTPFIRRTLNYDQAKCKRDIGYLLSAVQTDIVNGNNSQSIINGQFYYNGAVSVLPSDQITPTVQAIQQTKTLTKFFTNTPSSSGSLSSIDISFNTIINIISGGLSNYTPVSYTPSYDASTATALISANASNIQDGTLSFINTLYPTLYGWRKPFVTTSPYIQGCSSITKGLNSNLQNQVQQKYNNSVYSTALNSVLSTDFLFQTVINIVSGGVTNFTPITSTPPTDATVAQTLLTKALTYIQEETVGYIDTLYSSFKYDEAKCRRDIGYILSAVRADIVNGNNSESIYNGLKYYEGAVSVLPAQQIQPTVQAFSYTKALALSAITNPASINSLTSVSLVFNTIINIISGGPVSAVPISFTPSVDALAAAALIEDNTEDIKIKTTSYINSLYNTLNYDKEKCKRDVGYILSAVRTDLKNGNNNQTILNGQFYYNGVVSVLPVDQVTPTVKALNRARQAAIYTLQGQAEKPSAVDSLTAINTYFNTIINIVSGGPTSYTSVTAGRPLDAIKAARLIEIAKPSIQTGTVTYVNSVYPTLSYSQAKCYRDVGYILSAIQFDLLKGDNSQSIYNGQQYYTGVIAPTAVLPEDQKIPTVAALVEAKKLAQQTLIGNYTFNSFLTSTYGPTIAPNVIDNITTCIETINEIITKGYNSYTVKTFTTTTDTTRAIELLQLHTPYIQEKAVEFVDQEYPFLNYNKNLCYRDVGYILSSIEVDLKNGNNTESIRSGQAYYTGVIAPTSILPSDQILPTTRAISEVGNLASYVVAGNYTKFTNITKTIDTINDIILNGTNSVSAQSYTPEPGALYAAQLIELNKTFIQKEMTGYIKTTYPSLSYNQDKCERDVNYILSAIQFDMQAGTNSQGIINGNGYYYGTNQSHLPNDQKVPTIMAFNYIGRLATFIAQNTPVVGIPAGGGMRVDGSDAEGFLRSFVLDSYTQFNEGGKGIYILNNGYAQLVSIFTICCSEGVLCESGGSCSINTSNCSFGLSGLVARGKSPTPVLSGTLANNPFRTNQILVDNVNGIQIYPNSTYYNPQSPIDTRQIAYTPYNGLVFTIGTDPTLYSIDNNPELVENSTDTYSITLANNLNRNFTPGEPIYFYIRSTLTTSSHTFEYIGSGTVLAESVPALGGVSDPTKEAVFGDGGIVFFTSTNQAGNFRVGTDFTILQATGTIEGDTFKRSILTLVTPLTLALE